MSLWFWGCLKLNVYTSNLINLSELKETTKLEVVWTLFAILRSALLCTGSGMHCVIACKDIYYDVNARWWFKNCYYKFPPPLHYCFTIGDDHLWCYNVLFCKCFSPAIFNVGVIFLTPFKFFNALINLRIKNGCWHLKISKLLPCNRNCEKIIF